MVSKRINDPTLFLLAIALLWLGSGLYIAVRPRAFIQKTQFPWTKLPVWGARLLGIAILIGGLLILRAYILRTAN
jgi:hypothetical protein